MGTSAPFAIGETHGLVTLPGNHIQASSARLGWTSLFVSAQHEEPFQASVDPVRDHLMVVHLGGPVHVQGAIDQRRARGLVPPGGIFLWPAGLGFRVGLEAGVDTLHLYIRSAIVDEVAETLGRSGTSQAGRGVSLAPRLNERDDLLEQLALEVRRAATAGDESAALYADHLALAIAARLVRSNAGTSSRADSPRLRGLTSLQRKRIEEYIEENLDTAIQLQALSEAGGLSVSQFVRQFKASMGLSPYQFVLQRRVERAKRLLKHGEDPIVQIALACGFSHQEHLTHTFKRFTGDTPASYRRAARN